MLGVANGDGDVMIRITTPLKKTVIKSLKAGDDILLSGVIYTARDQAHKRLVDLLKKGRPLPVDLSGQVIYYCGPTATPPGRVIGSCGPTTSRRMDAFTPQLLERGLAGMIGKGRREPQVYEAIKKQGAVYFAAPAGCGALLARHVVANECVAFPDLGPEAIHRLEVEDFPLVVIIDSKGRDIS